MGGERRGVLAVHEPRVAGGDGRGVAVDRAGARGGDCEGGRTHDLAERVRGGPSVVGDTAVDSSDRVRAADDVVVGNGAGGRPVRHVQGQVRAAGDGGAVVVEGDRAARGAAGAGDRRRIGDGVAHRGRAVVRDNRRGPTSRRGVDPVAGVVGGDRKGAASVVIVDLATAVAGPVEGVDRAVAAGSVGDGDGDRPGRRVIVPAHRHGVVDDGRPVGVLKALTAHAYGRHKRPGRVKRVRFPGGRSRRCATYQLSGRRHRRRATRQLPGRWRRRRATRRICLHHGTGRPRHRARRELCRPRRSPFEPSAARGLGSREPHTVALRRHDRCRRFARTK